CEEQAAMPTQSETAQVELDVLSCPSSCVCQYAAFDKLPIARWVNHMIGSNEDPDIALFSNVKLATCLLQEPEDTQELFAALPIDLQALILMHTGSLNSQLTGRVVVPVECPLITVQYNMCVPVNTSSFRALNQLSTLEIRGSGTVTLIIDEPLEFLQHANFEEVRLQASDQLQRPKYSKLPSDDYEYKPPSDVAANEVTPTYQLQFEAEAEIMSYEQHVERLKQTRMPSFYGWSRLEVLRIHSCQLNELHWQMFDGMTQLHHLSLERNGIEELQPFAFSGAPHLKSLSLAHNHVGRLFYLGLAGLLELETLQLSDNRLERLSESSFPPLPQLLSADLTNNPIMHILPATFWVMNDTRKLEMGSALAALELRSWNSFGQFDSLRKLQTLTLRNVSTTTLEQGVFKAKSLEELTLRGAISSVQFDAFAGMEQLRALDLSHCNIVELSMDALMGLKALQTLKLSHNRLSHLPNGLLDDQQRLEVVHLQENQLKTLPTNFFQLARLRVTRLDHNPWQCTCDMAHWQPRLTNAVQTAGSAKQCSDVREKCHAVGGYDKSLVPRCANYNGRSVYYVMRKQLHCGAMLILGSKPGSTRGLPHWRKLELQRAKLGTPRKQTAYKKRMAQRNSLEFALRQHRHKEQSQPDTGSQQMSNEI
ncbi:hypothetical protein KR222_002559, partial [Zaprionus bogoriensis]